MSKHIVDAQDRIHTVRDILNYLSSTREENGLCSILDHCYTQLNEASISLEFALEGCSGDHPGQPGLS